MLFQGRLEGRRLHALQDLENGEEGQLEDKLLHLKLDQSHRNGRGVFDEVGEVSGGLEGGKEVHGRHTPRPHAVQQGLLEHFEADEETGSGTRP